MTMPPSHILCFDFCGVVRSCLFTFAHFFIFLHTGLLVDMFGDYKYLFLMCGSVITAGGLFLFVMNIYNYHMLDKEKMAKETQQNQKPIEDQEQVRSSEAELTHTSEVTVEQTESEAKDKSQAQQSLWLEDTKQNTKLSTVLLLSTDVWGLCMFVLRQHNDLFQFLHTHLFIVWFVQSNNILIFN